MPVQDDYGQGINIASLTDAPDAGKLAKDIVNGLAQRGAMRFASASARGATLTSPVEGMMAWLQDQNLLTVYDGTAWVAVAAGTQAWTTPALASGYSANGNSNGTPQYRLVNLFGEQTVMWRGGLNVTYNSNGSQVNGGVFLASSLPAAVRPSSWRTVTAACSAVSSDSLSVKIDFRPDGTAAIVTQPGTTPPWVSLNNIMYSL